MIAALSQLVVVVESHAKGGALSTVDEAMERGVPVGVVPGSTLSPASVGTNALLFDGAMPLRNAADVLVALGVERRTAPTPPGEQGQTTLELDDLSRADQDVLDAVRGGSVHIDRLIELIGESPPVVGDIVRRLAERGWLDVHGHTVTATATLP